VDFLNLGLTALVVFCRIGACLMVAPAVASSRIPLPIRLYIGLGLTVLIAPSVSTNVNGDFSNLSSLTLVIFSESLIGLLFGLSIRIIFLALEVIGELISMCIGLSNNFGVPIDGVYPSPTITSFISVLVLSLFLTLDMHHKLISGIVETYRAIPLGSEFSLTSSLNDVVDLISDAFQLVIKIAFPFVFFSIVVNFSFGLVNKIIPQFPAYFYHYHL
jgi:flagellar biosynthetic protein FliR